MLDNNRDKNQSPLQTNDKGVSPMGPIKGFILSVSGIARDKKFMLSCYTEVYRVLNQNIMFQLKISYAEYWIRNHHRM